MAFDRAVVEFFAHHRSTFLDRVARGAMSLGTSTVVLAVVAVACVVYVVRGRRWRLAFAVVGAFVCSTAATGALKLLIERPRPPYDLALVHAVGSAMPSTHAARTAAVAVAVAVAFPWPTPAFRRVGVVVLGCLVAVIGICLVYLGTHWPADVIVGWILGTAIGLGAAFTATSVGVRSTVNP